MRLRYRILLYILLIVVIFAPWFAWQTDRNMVRRWLYPVKGQLAAWSTRCSAEAPPWLDGLAHNLAAKHDSPANQLAWVTPDGRLATCVNGWQATPLFSPRLQNDTPMRLASLSKLVSFFGMLATPEAKRSQWLSQPLVKALDVHGPYQDGRVADIRIHQLLTHAAGFDRLRSVDPMTVRDKQPWCPYQPQHLTEVKLDYPPGSKQSYHNLDYCLAALAYRHAFGQSLWQTLADKLHIADYGLAWLEDRDSPVHYNYMHESFYGPRFPEYFDWHALRAPMGLTGNARGLARFVDAHRDLLHFAQNMHTDAADCDTSKSSRCYDGFLQRLSINGHRLWRQKGYLYGMEAGFLTDAAGHILIWLGAGEDRPLSAPHKRIVRAFVQATD